MTTSMGILVLLSMISACVVADGLAADAPKPDIPVCDILPHTSDGPMESGGGDMAARNAAPWSEKRLDLMQLQLLSCFAKQEAAYRKRGDHIRAAAARSRMRGIRQVLCLDVDQHKMVCP